jgi:Zn-finger nucleic acid-binding protein
MEKRSVRGVLLDYCPACTGIWLDGGELESIDRRREGADPEHAVQARAEAADERGRPIDVHGLCPRCQARLELSFIGAVEVDRCGRCGGIFFDQGELQTILRFRRRSGLARLLGWLRRK